MMKRAGHVECMGERNAYRILVRKPEGKRPLRRYTNQLKDNIKKHFKEIDGKCVHWIHVAQNRDQWQALVNIEINL
jgi:hypothetical protein